jgi:hypothetical protein
LPRLAARVSEKPVTPLDGDTRTAISEGMVALLKDYYGVGQRQAKTYYHDDLVVCDQDQARRRGWSRRARLVRALVVRYRADRPTPEAIVASATTCTPPRLHAGGGGWSAAGDRAALHDGAAPSGLARSVAGAAWVPCASSTPDRGQLPGRLRPAAPEHRGPRLPWGRTLTVVSPARANVRSARLSGS